MAPKKSSNYVAYSGYVEAVPSNQHVSSSRGRYLSESSAVESSMKSAIKGDQGRSSNNFSKSYKSEEFVDQSTGRLGYKEEAKFKSTYKYDDVARGYTNEYVTQVKFKHVSYPMKNTSNNKTKHVDYY